MRPRRFSIVVLALVAALLLAAALPAAASAAVSFVDTQVKMNILLLRGYIDTQAGKHGFVYLPRSAIRKGGALVAPVWPGNPWTGKTMAPGTSRGTYTYSRTATGYKLVGHLSKGSYVVSGGLPGWLKSERDQATRTGVHLVGEAIMRSVRLNAGALPAAATAEGLAPLMWPWPVNAYSGAPMAASSAVGDYGYSHTAGDFTITGHLSGGKPYAVTRTLTQSQQ